MGGNQSKKVGLRLYSAIDIHEISRGASFFSIVSLNLSACSLSISMTAHS